MSKSSGEYKVLASSQAGNTGLKLTTFRFGPIVFCVFRVCKTEKKKKIFKLFNLVQGGFYCHLDRA